MSAVDEILTDIPMDQLASLLGVDEATAEQATRQAIPALLGGMQANAEDPAGAASLAGALGDHPSDLIDDGVDLDQVDAMTARRSSATSSATTKIKSRRLSAAILAVRAAVDQAAADLGADRPRVPVQAPHGSGSRGRRLRSVRRRDRI